MTYARAALTVVSLAAALSSSAARADTLGGTFSSPLGNVTAKETEDGTFVAKFSGGKNPCGMKKGAVVFDGMRLDDSIVGSLTACKTGDGCTGSVVGQAMLLVTRGGNALSGAVHFDGACKTPLGGDSITLRKAAAPKPRPPKVDVRKQAETLAKEALDLLNGEGNAELARQKLQEAVKLDPTYAEGYIGIGVSYFVRDRYDEALAEYKRALEANPSLPDAYYNTACVYAVKGDSVQSLRYLRIALLNGYVDLKTLKADPDLKSLQGNEKFEKLLLGDITE